MSIGAAQKAASLPRLLNITNFRKAFGNGCYVNVLDEENKNKQIYVDKDVISVIRKHLAAIDRIKEIDLGAAASSLGCAYDVKVPVKIFGYDKEEAIEKIVDSYMENGTKIFEYWRQTKDGLSSYPVYIVYNKETNALEHRYDKGKHIKIETPGHFRWVYAFDKTIIVWTDKLYKSRKEFLLNKYANIEDATCRNVEFKKMIISRIIERCC